MLFPSSAISQMQTTSNVSMQDTCRIYTPGQATGFGEDPAADTDHYDDDCHVQDGKAAVIRERGGDASLDANAVIRVPLSATGYDQDGVKVEATYGSTGNKETRTGTIRETRRGRTAIWLFVKWEDI